MPPAIAGLIGELDAASAEARRLWDTVPADRLGARPSPDVWSPAENLEHLSLTAERFLPALREGVESLPRDARRPSGPLKPDLIGRLFRWILEPPVRLRVKTTQPFEPLLDAGSSPDAVLERFLALQGQLRSLYEAADGWAADRVKVTSPFAKSVKYSLYSALLIIPAHERRHLWQARRAAGVQ